jgi:protein TonB
VAGRSPNAGSRTPAAAYADAEPVFQPSQSEGVKMGGQKHKAESKGKPKKTAAIATVGSLAVLLILGSLGYSKLWHKTAMPNQSAAPQPAMANTPKPEAASPATANMPTTTATTTAPDVPLRVQSEMSHQLTAPSKISDDLRKLTGKEPPPSSGFSAAGMEGLGNSGSVFNTQGGPKVKVAAPQKVSISSGIAVGLLIQRTPPVYPQMAKQARVSGTVVIQATISKGGTIENLHVVNGPAMLRQAALDAVKNWRYRPYLLSGQPVEVETTVNVTFALGG